MPTGCGIGIGTPFMQSSGVPLPPFPWTPDFTPFQFEVAVNATGNGGSGNNTIRLPFRPIVATKQASLAAGWAIDVDWGDGQTTSYTSFPTTDFEITHTYGTSINRIISISMNAAATVNTLKGWSYGSASSVYNSYDSYKFLRVLNWGIFDFAADVIGDSGNQEDYDTANYFAAISNTVAWKPTFPPHISGTSLRGLWSGDYRARNGQVPTQPFTCPYLSQWDTSGVQSLQETCSLNYGFNSAQLPAAQRADWSGLSNWDVSNVTNMEETFYRQISLLGPEVESWNVSNVTTMFQMFRECENFNGNISSWNTSNCKNFSSMFQQATIFNQPLDSWDVSNAEYSLFPDFNRGLKSMFRDASSFDQYLGSWDVSNNFEFDFMFSGCTSFGTGADRGLGNWVFRTGTSGSPSGRGVSMQSMFAACTNFNDDISSWNVSNVSRFDGFLGSAQAFNRDLGSWDMTGTHFVGSGTNQGSVSGMFAGATNVDFDMSSWDLKQTGVVFGFMNNPFNGPTPNDPTLSVSNYDATLVAFGARVPYTRIPLNPQFQNNYFTFGNSKYTGTDTAVVAGRNALINDLGNLQDGGAV